MQQRNAAVVAPPGVLHGQSQRQRRAIECSRVKRNTVSAYNHMRLTAQCTTQTTTAMK